MAKTKVSSKIHKVYPSFFNGVTEQSAEMAMNNQCKAMLNCVPDLVMGLQKRPPVTYVKEDATLPVASKIIHTYDRGEDNEEYIFVATGDVSNPLAIFHKNGTAMTVEYDVTDEADLKSYLSSTDLKALTVQDRTWIINKTKNVGLDTTGITALDSEYDLTAYYWLKRGSGDRYNPYNYAVYLDGKTYAVNPDKPSSATSDPATGAEDSDFAADVLATAITSDATTRFFAGNEGSIIKIVKGKYTSIAESTYVSIISSDANANTIKIADDATGTNASHYNMLVNADIVEALTRVTQGGYLATGSTSSTTWKKVTDFPTYTTGQADATGYHDFIQYYNDTNLAYSRSADVSIQNYHNDHDFTFDSWDSWGNQASEGWKGSVNKITDLPKDMPFSGIHVEIKGTDTDTFTNYYVKWNGSSWEECLDPKAIRGRLTNMPIKCDRTALVAGVATFTISKESWDLPRVGNLDNNPDPSFVNYTINDLFFYKNRFGIASEDSVVLTETASYTNFYIKTALDIVDTDPVDVSLATNQASKIYFVKPFNNSLYIFTKYSQFELEYEGMFSPNTVSMSNVTNYPMSTQVEPQVVNDSMYFISTTNNRQQLREYIKGENLKVTGVDINVATPTYLEEPITKLIVNGVLGFVLCATANNSMYLYSFKSDGTKRIQSAWSKWTLLDGLEYTADSFEYALIDSTMIIACKTATSYLYHKMELDDNIVNGKEDSTKDAVVHPYTSSVTLPDFYPHVSEIGNPKDKVLIKKVIIQGTGNFDASVYRKDYNKTYTKSHLTDMRDLDLHVSSKVGNVDITIEDSSANDFVITSVVLEGLYNRTSREIR